MAEILKFYKSSGRLIWPGKGEWKALSGGHGDPLPSLTYEIDRRGITGYGKIARGFQNKTGKGFFIPLKPNSKTTRGTRANGRFGIHPDGGSKGTQGCIGLQEKSKSFYDMIRRTSINAELYVRVTN